MRRRVFSLSRFAQALTRDLPDGFARLPKLSWLYCCVGIRGSSESFDPPTKKNQIPSKKDTRIHLSPYAHRADQ